MRAREFINKEYKHVSLRRKWSCIGESITAIAIMRNLAVLDLWPDLFVQEMKVRHIFVSTALFSDISNINNTIY